MLPFRTALHGVRLITGDYVRFELEPNDEANRFLNHELQSNDIFLPALSSCVSSIYTCYANICSATSHLGL